MAKASEELLETQRKNKWTETPGIQHVLNFTLSPSGRHDIGETTPSFDESEVHIRAWKRLEEQFWDNATYFMHPALEYILTYFLPGKLKQKQEYFKHRLMTTVYNAIREYANYRREFELGNRKTYTEDAPKVVVESTAGFNGGTATVFNPVTQERVKVLPTLSDETVGTDQPSTQSPSSDTVVGG